jgi:hypothetical protein
MDRNQLLVQENKLLCKERRPVYEATKPRWAWGESFGLPEGAASEGAKWKWTDLTEAQVQQILEASKSKKQTTYRAKIGEADKKNQNNRIYPEQVWQDQIDKFTPAAMARGEFAGAVDHPDYWSGGSLKDTCIIWRTLEWGNPSKNEDEEELGVYADYVIIEDHSAGKDFKAQCDSTLNVGFSTYGYGTAHIPGDAERKQYKLGENEMCVIMNRDYDLRKADAVDDPSVATARLIRRERSSDDQSTGEGDGNRDATSEGIDPNAGPKRPATRTEDTTMDPINTLAELQTKAPKAFEAHTAAVTAAKSEVQTKLTAAEAENAALKKIFNGILPELKKLGGIELPEREVLPGETAEEIASLTAEMGKRDATIATLTGEKATLQQQIDAGKATEAAAKADKERRDKATAKLAEALKGEKHKDVPATIKTAITKAGEKAVADATFTEATVDAFIAEKLAEYAALGTLTQPEQGERGTTSAEIDDDDGTGEGAGDAGDEETDPEILKATEALEKQFPSKRKPNKANPAS